LASAVIIAAVLPALAAAALLVSVALRHALLARYLRPSKPYAPWLRQVASMFAVEHGTDACSACSTAVPKAESRSFTRGREVRGFDEP
jgi:hypothetical protein